MSKDLAVTENFVKSERHPELEECEERISNIGWSLGNACPCNCTQCYSLSVRNRSKDITKEMIDRIVEQISTLNVKTVNLGGNEPWYTNGLNDSSQLPYIIEKLKSINVDVGITTSGVTMLKLKKYSPKTLELLNDVDISLDSPIEEEHNRNRGAKIYQMAIEALEIAKEYNLDRSIIVCAMKWNFTKDKIDKFLELCKKYDANIRFNMLKPMKKEHMEQLVGIEDFYENYSYLLNKCYTIDITEPHLTTVVNNKKSNRCPCGRTSLRIHSITPEGTVPVSPCVYLHDYKVGDLLKDELKDIIKSEPFKEFRRRNKNPKAIKECSDCEMVEICGGGCAAKAYLYNYWKNGEYSIYKKEPNCYKDYGKKVDISNYEVKSLENNLVHMDYLCTWIGKPKE